ncbi:MAG TPA: manganese efflux pump [Chloroflexota bacterium]
MVGLLVVSVSLGLSNFAAAVGIGISGVDAQTRLKTGLTFGFFEAVTPILGLLLGSMLAGWLAVLGHYGGAGLLVLTGSYLLLKALRDRGASPSSDGQQVDFHHLLLTGFALSADNLVVGFALGIYHVPIVLAAALIAVVSVSMSLVGLELGNRLGIRFGRGSAALGAVVLILVGFALGLGLLQ